MTVNAIDVNGVVGYQKTTFQSNKAFYVAFTLPQMMTLGDRLNISVNLGNLNSFALNAQVVTNITAAAGAFSLGLPTAVQQVKASSAKTVTVPLTALAVTNGPVSVTISASATRNGVTYIDSFTTQVTILPKGFPRSVNYGGAIGSQIFGSQTP